jgi:hypothetical protein
MYGNRAAQQDHHARPDQSPGFEVAANQLTLTAPGELGVAGAAF